MNLLTPDPGLVFWMTISFGIVVFILAKFGFPVIVKMVEERKAYIEDSLVMAEKARTELETVKEEAARIIAQANHEQVRILHETSQTQEKMLNEARVRALEEAEKIITNARRQIVAEKDESIREMRRMVAGMSLEIVRKVLRSELNTNEKHAEMIHKLIDESAKRQS